MDRRSFIQAGLLAGIGGVVTCCGCSKTDSLTNNSDVIGKEFIFNMDTVPKRVRLDVCSLCNLKCPACYMRNDFDKKHVGYGYVSFEQFKKFIEENNFIKQVEISKSGEIFLNPDLLKIIQYAYENNIKLSAVGGTSLNTLTDEMAEALVKYQFETLVVSIDAATAKTYPIYRQGGDFNTVINNILKINHYKEKYNSQFPILIYKFILFSHNIHEIDLAAKKAKELNMKIQYELNYEPSYHPIKEEDIDMVYKKTGLLVTNKESDRVKHEWKCYSEKKEPWFTCHALWNIPTINWNGELFGCCYYRKGFNINVFEEGLLNALNNPKVLYARKMLTDFSTPIKEDIPCSSCKVYNMLKHELNQPLTYNIYNTV